MAIWRQSVLFAILILPPGVARTEERATVETKIGIEGTYYLRTEDVGLVAKPVAERSPIVLRVANTSRDGQSLIYELRYIGATSGPHDLRDYLLTADGQPPKSFGPLTVMVRESLPADHDGSLDAHAFPAAPSAWPYRTILRAALAAWAALTVFLIGRWLTRRQPRPIVATKEQLTLADHLRPLVERAIAGGLSVSEQARLERLLLGHWREALQLGALSPDEALRQMRSHDEAGRLLRELEAWLHARPGTKSVDVAGLLAPYRAAGLPGVAHK